MNSIKDRFIKCNMKLAETAEKLNTTPKELFKVLDSNGESDPKMAKKLIKEIVKRESSTKTLDSGSEAGMTEGAEL